MDNPTIFAIESEFQDFWQKYCVSERKFKIISNINFNLYTIAELLIMIYEKVSNQEAVKLLKIEIIIRNRF